MMFEDFLNWQIQAEIYVLQNILYIQLLWFEKHNTVESSGPSDAIVLLTEWLSLKSKSYLQT